MAYLALEQWLIINCLEGNVSIPGGWGTQRPPSCFRITSCEPWCWMQKAVLQDARNSCFPPEIPLSHLQLVSQCPSPKGPVPSPLLTVLTVSPPRFAGLTLDMAGVSHRTVVGMAGDSHTGGASG